LSIPDLEPDIEPIPPLNSKIEDETEVTIQSPIKLHKQKNNMNHLKHTTHLMTLKTPPPYSNLKGRNKPTFREWNAKHKYTMSKQNLSFNEQSKQIKKNPSKKKVTRHIKTIKYNLGKKGRNINVLIKNNNTRKKIKT